MKALDLMSAPVVSVDPAALVTDVARTLLRHGIGAVLVVEADRLIGIVSDGDLLRRTEIGTEPTHSWLGALLRSGEEAAAEFLKTHGQRAEDVMTRDVITVGRNADLREIVDILEARKVRRVVVADDGRALGIVSQRDILHALIAATRRKFNVDLTSEQVRDLVLANIASAGLSRHLLDLKVVGDRAEISAIVESEIAAKALIAAVEASPGIAEIEDRIRIVPKNISNEL